MSTSVPAPVKAIPTQYAGHEFRSRLEARWAVFFDHLHISWDYEPEGYELPHGRYLPDFYLPSIHGGCWYEVKGQEPTTHELDLAGDLAITTRQPVLIAWGRFPLGVSGFDEYPRDNAICFIDSYADEAGNVHPGWDEPYVWCTCKDCGKIGVEYDGRGARVCRHDNDDKDYRYNDPRLVSAYTAARTRRFWDPT